MRQFIGGIGANPNQSGLPDQLARDYRERRPSTGCPYVISGATTSGSVSLKMSSIASIVPNQIVTGAGIQSGSYVISFRGSSDTVTLNLPATATGTGVFLSFYPYGLTYVDVTNNALYFCSSTGWTAGAGGSGTTVQVNGGSTLGTANFSNGTGAGEIDFSNPSGSTVNAALHNTSLTFNGQSVALGGSNSANYITGSIGANDLAQFAATSGQLSDSLIATANVTQTTSTPAANQLCVFGSTAKTCTPTTTLPTAAVPAFTGDMSNSGGSLTTTVGKVNGVSYPASPSTSTVPVVTSSNTITYQNAPAISGANLTALPSSTGLYPILNQNTAGYAGGIAGGLLGSAPYQNAVNTTLFISGPITNGHTFFYGWQPTGSAIAPAAIDLGTYLASPPAIGGTAPAAGAFSSITDTGAEAPAGQTYCLQINASGVMSNTGAACGSGSGAVNSVTNSDGTLTISPTTGSVVASLNPGHANTFTANQTAPVFISNIATGTAPFTVSSTTPVANLSIGGNAATATNATSAMTATNLSGATTDSVPYQSGAGATSYLAPQTTNNDYAFIEHVTASAAVAPTWSNAPALSGANLTALPSSTGLYPTLNQSTTGNAATATTASGLSGSPTAYQFWGYNGTAQGWYAPIVLTTTGSSGAATYTAATNTLNIPNYAGGGGDTITSPNSTLNVGGTSSNTTLDIKGAAGQIMAGATPALTAAPALGTDNSAAGTLQLANGSAAAHTILGSAATTSNTVLFPATAPTNLDCFYAAVSGTTTTLTDCGYPYNAIPNADLAHSTISGIALGNNLGALTFGAHLTSGGSSYNGSIGVTITSDATNANTASTIVARDSSGNFSAGTITASLSGNATTATDLASYPTLCSGGQFSQGLSPGSNNCATPSGSGTAFQVNGTGLTSSTTVNFENSAATDGLTLTFANPSAGNVQLGFSGTLTAPGGGTGVGTLSGFAYGNGTSAFTAATAAQLGTLANLAQYDIVLSGGTSAALAGLACGADKILEGSATNPTCTATPQLGLSGTLGSLTMGNATSGTITLEPVTGALGSITEYLPISSGDTLAGIAAAQTLTNKSIAGSEINSGLVASAYGGTGVNNTATITLGTSNHNWATLGTGIVKNTTTTGALSDAAASDVISLWTGTCSSSTWLNGAGVCTAPSGSGTVNSGSGYAIPAYGSSASTTVGPSNITTDSTGNNLIVPGSVTSSPASGDAGIFSLVGNTVNPACPTNQFCIFGFDSASATAYGWQPSTTAPSGTQVMLAGTPSSGASPITYESLAGSGSGITTGPTSSTTLDVAEFTGTGGQIADSGTLLSSLAPKASPTFTGTVTTPLTTAGLVTTTIGGVLGSEANATIAQGGTGTGSTLTGLVRGSASAMTAAELSGDAVTSGSNAVTVKGLEAVPFCTGYSPTNGQLVQYTTGGSPNPCYTSATGSGGGDTISSPNSTLVVGGTIVATTLDLAGAAGQIMAGATPALTYTPSLGKSGTAGTLALYPPTGNFTTTLGSAATASNTVDFFAAVPTNLDLFYCAVSSTTCTLTDAGYAYNAIPNADLTHSAITIAGTSVSLGGSTSSLPSPGAIGGTTPAAITGTTITANTNFNDAALTASLPVCTDASKNLSSTCTGLVTNADLANSSITIAGTSVALGGSTSSLPSPGAIGGTTPAAITGTTIQANTQLNAGSAGTLAPLVMGNATSGLLTIEPATGAITAYTLELPVAQPSGSNTYLSCTAANPAVCTWSTPAGTGANTALSNLASVSINTSLLAQTGVDLGSTTNPFRNLYLFGSGTYGTDSFELTGTSTANRTVTLPDNTGTVAELNLAQTWTANQTFPSASIAGTALANNGITATQLAAQYSRGQCAEVWGGSGTSFALTSGDDAISNNSCYNDSGVTRTITAVKCLSDNASNTTTVNPTFGSAGTGTTILSGALTCGNSNAMSSSGTVSNASWTTGTGIDPAMGGTLTGTHIVMQVDYTY